MDSNSKSPPRFIGKYTIMKQLAHGGMGVIYKGFDPSIERVVAIKTVHEFLLQGENKDEILIRFEREARAAGRLSHPNIVMIHEFGLEKEMPFIAMEFIEGNDLSDFIEPNVPMELNLVIKIMKQILDGLSYCHDKGVVHRDLKPPNIILVDGGVAKIADFGIARLDSSDLTATGSLLGTPNYMAPEQLEGKKIDNRTDLFATGAILYEMLTGSKAFPGKVFASVMHNILSGELENLPSVLNRKLPQSFDTLILKSLSRLPGERFQSAREFSEALDLAAKDNFSIDKNNDMMDHTVLDFDARILMPDRGGSQDNQHSSISKEEDNVKDKDAIEEGLTSKNNSKKIMLSVLTLIPLIVVILGIGLFYNKPNLLVEEKREDEIKIETNKNKDPINNTGVIEKEQVIRESTIVETGSSGYYSVIDVVSMPLEAELTLDGEKIGTTPQEFELPPGRYELSVLKSGFITWTTLLDVDESTDLKVIAHLPKEL